MRELTEETLQREIVDAAAPAVVEVWAHWCPYSRLARPKLERLQRRFGDRLLVRRLDAGRHPEVVPRLGLQYIPALVLFRDGRAVRRLYGDRHFAEIEAYLERFHIPD